MRRFFSLVILLCICFAMSIPAYATSSYGGSTGIDGIFNEIIGTDSGNVAPKQATSSSSSFNEEKLLDKYKELATFITAILTATSIFALFYFISKLSLTAGSHEIIRKRAIMGIATSAVGVALMGSATIILAFFYNFLK